MNNNKDYFELRYFLEDASFVNWAKNLNKNDVQYWNNWIRNNPAHIETVENARAIIIGINFKKQFPEHQKVEEELSKILPKIGLGTSKLKNNKKTIPLKRKLYYSAAAMVLFLLSWTSSGLFNNYNTTVHKTNFGEIIDLKLPDGTSVVLNGNSEISYDKENPRFLKLKGEAYFKVKPIASTNAKFWVITNDLKVEVLGTQFHVNTRKKKTKVVLDEGSIHLEFKNGNVAKMIPGEYVSYSTHNEKVVHEKVTLKKPYALWRGGTYVFNEIPLKEVMLNLELTYGIKIEYGSEHLKEIPITGGIPNQNLKICIAAIEKATLTRIIHKGNTLRIQENTIN